MGNKRESKRLKRERKRLKKKKKSIQESIQEHSKERIWKRVSQANFSALIKSSFKAFKKPSIQAYQLLKRSINSPSTLRKFKKGLLLLSKVYLKLYSLIKGAFLVLIYAINCFTQFEWLFLFWRDSKIREGWFEPRIGVYWVGLYPGNKWSSLG